MGKIMKRLVVLFTLLTFISCTKKGFEKGQCIEEPLGAYTYQIADVQEDHLLVYTLGVMGKKIIKVDPKKKKFVQVNCP